MALPSNQQTLSDMPPNDNVEVEEYEEYTVEHYFHDLFAWCVEEIADLRAEYQRSSSHEVDPASILQVMRDEVPDELRKACASLRMQRETDGFFAALGLTLFQQGTFYVGGQYGGMGEEQCH